MLNSPRFESGPQTDQPEPGSHGRKVWKSGSTGQDVEELYGTNFAFAAIRRDGRILAWGAVGAGGDMSEAEKQLPYL